MVRSERSARAWAAAVLAVCALVLGLALVPRTGQGAEGEYRLYGDEMSMTCRTEGRGGPSYTIPGVMGVDCEMPLGMFNENGRTRTYGTGSAVLRINARQNPFAGNGWVGSVERVTLTEEQADAAGPFQCEERLQGAACLSTYYPYGDGEAYRLSLSKGFFSPEELQGMAEGFRLGDAPREPDVWLYPTEFLGYARSPSELGMGWENGTDRTLTAGPDYRLERLDNARWEPVGPLYAEVQVAAHGIVEVSCPLFGPLENGWYRVVGSYLLEGETEARDAYLEFSVGMEWNAEGEIDGVELRRWPMDGYTVALCQQTGETQCFLMEWGDTWAVLSTLTDHPDPGQVTVTPSEQGFTITYPGGVLAYRLTPFGTAEMV